MKSHKHLLSIALVSSLGTGCVSQSTYDALRSKFDEQQKQSAGIREYLADANQIIVETRPESVHAVPVNVYLCQGYMLLWNSLDREIPVKVIITSPSDGSSESFNLVVPASGIRRVPKIHFHQDHGDFNHLEDGDTVKISSPEFDPIVWTIHQVLSYGP